MVLEVLDSWWMVAGGERLQCKKEIRRNQKDFIDFPWFRGFNNFSLTKNSEKTTYENGKCNKLHNIYSKIDK